MLFWTHGWTRDDRFHVALTKKVFFGMSHMLLLYGERARRLGIRGGFRSRKLNVIYNSVNFELQRMIVSELPACTGAEMRQRLFGSEHRDTPTVIVSARLTPGKQFELAIIALGRLKGAGRQVNLVVIGDGPKRRELEVLACVEGVLTHFVGECYDEKLIAQYFAASCLTVSPGNIGLTCMHSLGYGVPVLTHDDANAQGPEWEAIRPGVNGDLFRKGSLEDLSEKLNKWTSAVAPSALCASTCVESIAIKYTAGMQVKLLESGLDELFG